MNAWLFLITAIMFEVLGTTALKLSEGFTRPLPSLFVVLGYGISFYLFALSLRHIPLGVAYAVWSGMGTTGMVVIGILLWQEVLDAPRVIGVVLIISGVAILNLFSTPVAG